jgi:hypothetical protein
MVVNFQFEVWKRTAPATAKLTTLKCIPDCGNKDAGNKDQNA